MKLDGFSNLLLDFGCGCTRGNTARKVGHVCRIIASSIFNDNRVSHYDFPFLFQSRLLQDTVESPWSQIVAKFARYSYPTRLARMLELPMATPRSN